MIFSWLSRVKELIDIMSRQPTVLSALFPVVPASSEKGSDDEVSEGGGNLTNGLLDEESVMSFESRGNFAEGGGFITSSFLLAKATSCHEGSK